MFGLGEDLGLERDKWDIHEWYEVYFPPQSFLKRTNSRIERTCLKTIQTNWDNIIFLPNKGNTSIILDKFLKMRQIFHKMLSIIPSPH